jgi:hypothetical protein
VADEGPDAAGHVVRLRRERAALDEGLADERFRYRVRVLQPQHGRQLRVAFAAPLVEGREVGVPARHHGARCLRRQHGIERRLDVRRYTGVDAVDAVEFALAAGSRRPDHDDTEPPDAGAWPVHRTGRSQQPT